jgi:hypothetical protein
MTAPSPMAGQALGPRYNGKHSCSAARIDQRALMLHGETATADPDRNMRADGSSQMKLKLYPCLVTAVTCMVTILVTDSSARAQTDEWRKRNDRGNRYEGRVSIEVAKPDLRLLSFFASREAFEKNVDLHVRFFLPAPAHVFIQARELREIKKYWMEAKPGQWEAGRWNEFAPWPTGSVLIREGVPYWNLGVLIRINNSTTSGRELLPAIVYHSALRGPITHYTMHLQPTTTLRNVQFSLSQMVDNKERNTRTWESTTEKVAGQPFSIDFDLAGQPEGWMRLIIEGFYSNRPGGPLQVYTFYHKPDLGLDDSQHQQGRNTCRKRTVTSATSPLAPHATSLLEKLE